MNFNLTQSKIIDKDLRDKIINSLNLLNVNIENFYDVTVEYYNKDILFEKLNENIMFEMKPEHYKFIKMLRELCDDYKIKVNCVYLLGSISNIDDGEMRFLFNNSNKENQKENIIWPCKEIFLYDGSKKLLDNLLDNNQITYEEYKKNLELLQDEFGIYEIEEKVMYKN